MAGYNSKFTGQQVDSLLEKAGSSYQKPETGIPQSDLDESTQQILQNVENKVSKEEGKGLSTNDFTDEYKAKVEDSAAQEGYFPKMSVGIAANLAGRGEATEQVFTYRPTDGGTSIESGVAKIRRVKGNSVVWNQLSRFRDTWTEKGLTATNNGNEIHISGTVTEAFNYDNVLLTKNHTLKRDGRKYLVSIEAPTGVTFGLAGYSLKNSSPFIWSQNDGTDWGGGVIAISVPLGTTMDYTFKNPIIVDLTQMFGAGNEPTTVEEFRALYPDSYYPYNVGELRNLDCNGIKTVGFNQWDEQWEVGYLNADGTTAGYVQNYIRAKNYIPVIGGAMYYAKLPNGVSDAQLFVVDENYNFIKQIFPWGNALFVIPDGAAYIRFYMKYGSEVYNNNICINLHHTGWRDGDYEPYKEVTHSLPLSQITNGEPLRKAGSVYDEITETEYIKRVGVVDLGSLTYRKSDNYPNLFISNPFGAAGADADKIANLFCPKYIAMTATSPWSDIISMGMDTSKQLYIYDPQYTDIEVFKSAMSGVMLNYELAEPIVTPIETSLNLDYQADDFGTEEALLTGNSAPFSADIVYQFNAVDRIRENSLDIEDLLARVIALENAAATTTSIPDIPDIPDITE